MTARFEGTLSLRPGCLEPFLAWKERYHTVVSRSPGLTRAEWRARHAGATWTTRLEFRTPEDLQGWLESEARSRLLEDVLPLVDGGLVAQFGTDPDDNEGVAEVFLSRLKPGREEDYRLWEARISKAQAAFPGFLGSSFQPPTAGQRDWVSIIRYDSAEHLQTWLDSAVRQELLKAQSGLLEAQNQYRLEANAFPGWIPTAPPETTPPPAWKTTMLVLLGLFPVVMLLGRFLGPFLNQRLSHSPATLLSNAISATVVGLVTMPLALRAFGWWVFLRPTSPAWTTPAGVALLLLLYGLEMLLFWS